MPLWRAIDLGVRLTGPHLLPGLSFELNSQYPDCSSPERLFIQLMPPREFLRWAVLLGLFLGSQAAPAIAAHPKSCVTADQAMKMVKGRLRFGPHL